MTRSRLLLWMILPLLAFAFVLAVTSKFAGKPKIPVELAGSLWPVARPVSAFSLPRVDGGAYTDADLQGHWTLMYFGFLQCPDVCPTTLASMAALRRRIEADPGSVAVPRLVFVTVDPENDSASAMASYTGFFDPSIVGVRADPAGLRGFADQLGVFYEEQIDERGVRSMAHTTSVLLIDPSGRGVAAFSATHDLRVFERQYRQMLEHVSSR